MAELDELRADLEELESLAKQAKRPRAKDLLQREVLRVTEQIKIAEKVAAQNETSQAAPEREEKVRVQKPQIYTTKITSYGWDQSEKFVKLYINLEGVEKLPKEKLDANFSSKSMDLVVRELKGKNYQLQIRNLLYEIIPSESSVRAKTGSVTVLMRKASTKTWECLTKLEKAEVDRKKPNVWHRQGSVWRTDGYDEKDVRRRWWRDEENYCKGLDRIKRQAGRSGRLLIWQWQILPGGGVGTWGLMKFGQHQDRQNSLPNLWQ